MTTTKALRARAAGVKQWLGSHGADAARLSSKGYGKTQPVADNGSDFWPRKNRQVELVKAGCRNQPKRRGRAPEALRPLVAKTAVRVLTAANR